MTEIGELLNMPYADKAKDNKCKREWELRQRENNTAYYQRKKKRVSKRKSQKRRDRIQAGYVKTLIQWPDAPAEIVRLKTLQLKLHRITRAYL